MRDAQARVREHERELRDAADATRNMQIEARRIEREARQAQRDAAKATRDSERAAHSSYIDSLRAAGVENLDIDHLIAMKVQGITPEWIESMRASGLQLSNGDLLALKVQGVTPEYVRKMREAGLKDASTGDILAMKVQGVDPAEAARFKHDLGASLEDVLAFKGGRTERFVGGADRRGQSAGHYA